MDTLPCPHYFSLFFDKLYSDRQVTALVGSQIDVPEYNDCQRLLVNNSGAPNPAYTDLRFGYAAAIFARANINSVYPTEAPIGMAKTQPFYAALQHSQPATTRVTSIGLVWSTRALHALRTAGWIRVYRASVGGSGWRKTGRRRTGRRRSGRREQSAELQRLDRPGHVQAIVSLAPLSSRLRSHTVSVC